MVQAVLLEGLHGTQAPLTRVMSALSPLGGHPHLWKRTAPVVEAAHLEAVAACQEVVGEAAASTGCRRKCSPGQTHLGLEQAGSHVASGRLKLLG